MEKEKVVKFSIKDCGSYFTIACVYIGIFDIITNLIVK